MTSKSGEEKVYVHLTMADKRKNIPEYVQGSACPKCGVETKEGMGYAGGGFGVYTYCPKCKQVTSKSIINDE